MTMKIQDQLYLRTLEVAEILGITPEEVEDLHDEGKLLSIRDNGGFWLFCESMEFL